MVNQEIVLDILNLSNSEKTQATNAIKLAIPGTLVKRKFSKDGTITFYENVACKSFSYTSTAASLTLSTATTSSTITLNENPDIANIKVVISNLSTELDSVGSEINKLLSEGE